MEPLWPTHFITIVFLLQGQLRNNPNTEIVFEEEKDMQDTPKTPEISFPEEDLVDLITDKSWLNLDAIGETPTPEDIFPTNHEDFKDFLYWYINSEVNTSHAPRKIDNIWHFSELSV